MTVTPAGEKASLLRCVWRAVEEGHVGKAVLWGSQERQPGLVRLAVWKGKAAPWVDSVVRGHTFLQKVLPQERKHETHLFQNVPREYQSHKSGLQSKD